MMVDLPYAFKTFCQQIDTIDCFMSNFCNFSDSFANFCI